MPISVLVWVRSFIAPDFWKQCTVRQYHSDFFDQSAAEIRVRIMFTLRVALFLHFAQRRTKTDKQAPSTNFTVWANNFQKDNIWAAVVSAMSKDVRSSVCFSVSEKLWHYRWACESCAVKRGSCVSLEAFLLVVNIVFIDIASRKSCVKRETNTLYIAHWVRSTSAKTKGLD